jgi:hypothetical protein
MCRSRCEANEQIVGLACTGSPAANTRIVDDPQAPGGKAAECSSPEIRSFSLICLRK